MRWLAPLLLLFCALPPAKAQQPWIAVIVDDLGNDGRHGMAAADLPGAVTLSLLPGTGHSGRIARRGQAVGKELMLHLPMASADDRALGPGALTPDMTPAQLADVMRDNLADLPGVRGINNHMGSVLPRQPRAMAQLMSWIVEHGGGLYFVDSRTDTGTVAELTAYAHGVPTTRRDVFLDNERDEAYIETQFRTLVRRAHEQGAAVAIGHPYPETLNVLRRELARLEHHGVDLVPVSRVIDRQQQCADFPPSQRPRIDQWHAYSSPLPPALRSSKPSP